MPKPTERKRNGRVPVPLRDRINATIRVAPTGCWEWTRPLTPAGYGQIFVGSRSDGNRRTLLAHRASYMTFVGPIPDNLPLDHLCRNRACVNPAHLEPVTLAENILRGIAPSAQNARKTHCYKGHEFTAENTYAHHGKRYCRACGVAYRAEYRAAKAKAAEQGTSVSAVVREALASVFADHPDYRAEWGAE